MKTVKEVTKVEIEVLKTNWKKEDLANDKFSKCVIQEKLQNLKPHEDSLSKVKLLIW